MELYEERVKELGKKKADRKFRTDVLQLLRPSIIKPADGTYRLNNYGMLKNFWKVGVRNTFNRKGFASINIVGLSVAIASFMVIQSYVSYEKSYDHFHENAKNIYRVDYRLLLNNKLLSHTATTPPTIAPFIADQTSGVNSFVRVLSYPGLVMRYGSSVYREDLVLIVDPSFFKIFDFNVLEGDPSTALDERGAMMISQRTKAKYFGDQDALGKAISIDGYKDYFVTGVFENPPKNSHLQFEFLLSFETANWWFEGETETDWTSRDYHSYILLDNLANLEDVEATIRQINLQTPQSQIDKENNVERVYELTKLEDIHLSSSLEEEIDERSKGNPIILRFLLIISALILVISWFNYFNQSAAKLFVRSKEVGLRKVMGASKNNLIFQFFIESVIVHGISIFLGLVLTLIVQYYTVEIGGFYFNLSFLSFESTLITVLIGFIISSIFPAIYISSIDPTSAIKGTLRSGSKGQFIRKILVSTQLISSIILIISTIIIFLQLHHISSRDLGFDIDNVLVAKGPSGSDTGTDVFMNMLEENPNVIQVSTGEHIPGFSEIEMVPIAKKTTQDLTYKNINTFSVGYRYLTTLNAKFIAGRDFDPKLKSDTASIIINRTAMQMLQITNAVEAIDTQMQFGSGYKVRVIGVIEDYLQTSVKSKSLPLVFWLYPDEPANFLIRYNGSEEKIKKEVEEIYTSFFQEDPFEYQLLEDFYAEQFEEDQQFSFSFLTFTIIAVLMSCLGLFSLIYWSTMSRTKEIGVRKALGAKVSQIVYLISEEFIKLAIISFVIAIPIAYFIMNDWLQNYASRIALDIKIFILSALATAILVLVTAGYRTLSSAKSNPIDCLHDE